MNWKMWLHSIVAAAIGGASNAALGAAAMPDTFNFTHQGWLNLGKLALMGALVPVLTLLKQSPLPSDTLTSSTTTTNVTKIGALVLAMFFAPALLAQTAANPTAPAIQTSNGFVGSSEAVAVYYQGEWSAGTHVTESFDFVDFGKTKANHLYVEGHEFMAPTPGFSIYAGGIKFEPNISSLLSKTNVNPSSFGVFLTGAVGNGIPSTGNSHVSYLFGGGAKYQVTSALSWQSLTAEYGQFGNQKFAAISTGLSFIFGK